MWYADNEDMKLDPMSIDMPMEGDEGAEATVERTFHGVVPQRRHVIGWLAYDALGFDRLPGPAFRGQDVFLVEVAV